jgi:outer membrane protein OmpA-like peptidoglycan-associated protein
MTAYLRAAGAAATCLAFGLIATRTAGADTPSQASTRPLILAQQAQQAQPTTPPSGNAAAPTGKEEEDKDKKKKQHKPGEQGAVPPGGAPAGPPGQPPQGPKGKKGPGNAVGQPAPGQPTTPPNVQLKKNVGPPSNAQQQTGEQPQGEELKKHKKATGGGNAPGEPKASGELPKVGTEKKVLKDVGGGNAQPQSAGTPESEKAKSFRERMKRLKKGAPPEQAQPNGGKTSPAAGGVQPSQQVQPKVDKGPPAGGGTPPPGMQFWPGTPGGDKGPPAAGGTPPPGMQFWPGTPGAKKGEKKEERVERHRLQFEELKKQRHEVVEEGGKRKIIEEPDKRRIIRQDGRITIRHDETERFRRSARETRSERRPDGTNVTIAIRPGGIQIFTELDDDGRPLRRYRRGADGREFVLFDNRPFYRRVGPRRGAFIDAFVDLPPPVIRIPRERYIVEYEQASDDDIYETLTAPPVDAVDHPYSLEEIRQSQYLRDRMRRLDLDTINFDFGSWEVDEDDYPRLERVARIMSRILERNPEEMFLIEGHTDAVGSEEDNLTLSDRRAEAVAEVLTETFNVPPENLTTQGYGEQFLKVPTDGPEAANRRVAIRRITPLLAR